MSALFAIQIFHTIITIVIFLCIGYVIYAGCRKRHGRLLQVCLFVMALEAVAIVASGFRCPLHLLVIGMTGNHHTPDILFPLWISKRIMKTGVLLGTVGLMLHIRNNFATIKNRKS